LRVLLPEPAGNVDLTDAYALPAPPAGRPFVRCNMISSFDGAITVNGKSGELGGADDRRVFKTLRALSDVILVGAGTMRTEGYGPAIRPIAVVTSSCKLDWSSPFFTEAENRPIIITTEQADPQRRRDAETVADVCIAGEEKVDLAAALRALYDRGFESVLLEGGPRLNAQVVEARLLDELCLTLSPRLVGGDGPRVLAGELPRPLDVAVVHLLEADGFLFYRLRVTAS
jgi:riboflavin biosynthesis pyrimidine reductase